MNTFERRIREIEEKIQPAGSWQPCLTIMHDTTFEEARQQYEEKTGQAITDEAFRKKLPELSKFIIEEVSNEGTRSNEWIEAYREKV